MLMTLKSMAFKPIFLFHLFLLNIRLINNTAYFDVDDKNISSKICGAPIICHALVCIFYENFMEI